MDVTAIYLYVITVLTVLMVTAKVLFGMKGLVIVGTIFILIPIIGGIILTYLDETYDKRKMKKLLWYTKSNRCQLIEKLSKKSLNDNEINSVLKNIESIRETDFPYSHIDYEIITGFSLKIKTRKLPYNIVVIPAIEDVIS